MTRALLFLAAWAVCLIFYGIVTSAERLLREVRQKLSRDRKAERLGREVQGFRVHDQLGRTVLEQDHAA